MNNGQEQTLLQRLAGAAPLPPAEQLVARFYEQGLPSAGLLNMAAVCAATGVSTATVARFARRLGYRGFREMTAELRHNMRAQLDKPGERLTRLSAGMSHAGVSAADAMANRFDVAADSLTRTRAVMDETALGKVTKLLADESRPLYLAAIASGRPLMRYFSLLVKYLRGGVVMLNGPDTWAHELSDLPANAVVLAACFEREPSQIGAVLDFADGRGATTVLITNRRTSSLVPKAGFALFIDSHADTIFRSRVALLALYETFLDAIADERGSTGSHADDVEELFASLGTHLATAQ